MIEYTNIPETNIIEVRTASSSDDSESQKNLERLKADIQKHGKLRVLHEVCSPLGADPSKFWRDARIVLTLGSGLSHIALVTDVDWLSRMGESTGRTLPANVKVFKRSQIGEARKWLKCAS